MQFGLESIYKMYVPLYLEIAIVLSPSKGSLEQPLQIDVQWNLYNTDTLERFWGEFILGLQSVNFLHFRKSTLGGSTVLHNYHDTRLPLAFYLIKIFHISYKLCFPHRYISLHNSSPLFREPCSSCASHELSTM